MVSLVLFNDTVEFAFFNSNATSLQLLTDESYLPNAGTALYDAVGEVIERLKKETDYNNEDNTYLISIITDGEENSSKKYVSEKIANLIKELQETNRWTFTYLGPNNVDLTKISNNLNINIANMKSYNADSSDGRHFAYAVHSTCLADYMSNVSRGVKYSTNFYNQPLQRDQNVDAIGKVKNESLQQV